MYSSDLLHRQVKVDAQYHNLVALDTDHNGEDDEATHDHENTEKDKGRNEKPMIQLLSFFKGNFVEGFHLL